MWELNAYGALLMSAANIGVNRRVTDVGRMGKRRVRRQKPPNGQANSGTYLLTFDLDDPAQVVAWEKAQELAGQRKLKHVLTGMLLAIETVERHTGKPVDMTVFMAQLVCVESGAGWAGDAHLYA